MNIAYVCVMLEAISTAGTAFAVDGPEFSKGMDAGLKTGLALYLVSQVGNENINLSTFDERVDALVKTYKLEVAGQMLVNLATMGELK